MYSYYATLTLRSQWPPHRPRLLTPDDSSDAATATDLTSLFLRGLPWSPKVLYRYYCLRQQPALLGWTYGRSAVRWRRAEKGRLCFCCCDGVGGREAVESIALLSEVERGGFAGKVGSCWEGEGLGWESGVSAGECGKVGSFREEGRKTRRDESSSGCTSSSSLSLSGELWDGSGGSSGCGKEEAFGRRRGRRRLGEEALSGKRLGGSSLANSRRKVGDAVESGAGGRVEKKGYVAEEELGSWRGQERMREQNRRLKDEIQRISGALETKESIMEENRRLRGEIERILRASEVKRGVTEENRRLQEEMEGVSRASGVKMVIVEENRRLREEIEGILARMSEAKENVIEENRKLQEDLTRISRALEVKGSVTEENGSLREEIERILRVSEVKENVAEENRRLRAEIERLSRTSHANENIEVENRRLREELERPSRISEVKNSTSEDNRRLVDEVDRRLKVSTVKEDVREENKKLWEEIEKISRTFEVNENIRKKLSYEGISEMKVEDHKEMSALTSTLLEEVTRQRQEINQLRDNYESLLRRSLVQDSHVVGMPAPSNAASSSRLEDREVISTSLASLVEELRRQSMVIEQLSRSYRELASSKQIAKSSSERVSSSEKVFISHLLEREKVSNSTVTTIKGGKDMKEDSGQQGPGSCRASIYELSASEKPENPPQGKYISDSREQLTAMDQHREDLQKTGSSELLVYGSNLNPISENALSAQDRQDAGSVEMAEPHESDSRWASSSGTVSVSELEDKVESKIFSNMTYIGNKKERHHYAGQLRIDNEKLFNSSQDSTCMQKPSTGVASAMNVTNLHGKQQHGYVDEKIEGSSKYTHVAPANKPAAGSPQDQEENSVIALVHEADKEKVESFLEKRTSGSITLTTTTSGDSDTSYISAETHQRLDEETRAEHLYQVRHDRLESASQFYRSSSQHVGEFANKVEQEMEGLADLDASTGSSGIHVEETSNEADQSSTSVSEEHKQKYIEEAPSQSSVLSEMKRPSDEIQDPASPCKGPSLADMTRQEYSEVPTDPISLPPTSGNAIVKRSGRSLWSYIADIIRMGWRPHAMSQTSTFGSGTRSSSNESMSSDGWFSGGERDEEDEQTKKRKLLPLKECDPGKRTIAKEKTAGQSSRTDYKRVNMEAETSLTIGTSAGVDSSKESLPVTGSVDSLEGAKVEHGVLSGPQTGLSFMGTSGEVYVSTDSLQLLGSNLRMEAETMGGTSSAVQSVDLTKGGTSSAMQSVDLTTAGTLSAVQLVNLAGGGISSAVQAVDLALAGISSSMQAVDLAAGSASSAMQTVDLSSQVDLPISTGVELEIARIDKVPMPKNGNVSRGKKLLKEGSLEIVEGEMKDGDLRRRKLQRAKQVPRERFDDWEETSSLESERRKLDEFFMREALLEAKKAAELWEVPIGAVLVQDGKIIARGSNMVEELRDSTAHAEMICIREASNYLKSWRLSKTTLYVTLEPCAMCAGAILQARIDSVVWGAPNKLLGADGSWVRLFPGGDEESSATSSQTAGPVHPFHPKITIRRGILEKECADVMQQFFQLRRKKDKEELPRPSRTSISAYPAKLMAKLHNIFSMMFCL